ncbi:RraA family protein (plasmid) [Arthrobacter sp. KN11-1C]|uniref:RraA family protein n=1 Tax=Arthrobacter sp. KN11-1C TaxID=3445774 RepID=UPI003FA017BA
MPVNIGPDPSKPDQMLMARAGRVAFPTLGHYLEDGFVDFDIRRQVPGPRVIGRVVTVKITATDSTMLHHAAGLAGPGDVLVVDTGGDRRHAPLGEVVASALHGRGAAGIVVDGLCTDIEELHNIGLPVYARGTTLLTTKLHGIEDGGLNIPVVCGGVVVTPGDVVLGDDNGLLITSSDQLETVLAQAIQDDQAEPALVAAVRDGRPLGELTGATGTIRGFSQA